jgi:hypothetical protein
MGEFNKLVFRFQKRKHYCFKLLRIPQGVGSMGIRPMLGSVSWGPYSHKAHALSFQLYPTLKISRKPEPEVL